MYLGVKMAAGSKFKQLIMVSSAAGDEMHLLNHAESVRGVYRGAPTGTYRISEKHRLECSEERKEGRK